jgi:putative tryptophan/tyrosine transport system substrate-binding protein
VDSRRNSGGVGARPDSCSTAAVLQAVSATNADTGASKACGVSHCGAWPAPARAQGKIPRVGYYWPGFPDPNVGIAGLRQGLQERGYVLGRNLILEERHAEGEPARTRELITELLARVDVLVTGDFALILAHTLTATVPIVGVAADFVGVGLAAKLSRPGGNITGMSLLSAEFSPKWLELVHAAVPKLNRVAFLGGSSPGSLPRKSGDWIKPRRVFTSR